MSRPRLERLRGSATLITVAVLGLALVCLGVGLLLRGEPASSAVPAAPVVPSAVAPRPVASASASASASPTPAAEKKLIGAPTGDVLVIPALSVQAPLVSVAMSRQQVLTPPRNPREVGYWDGSAPPGSASGQTLITGHTVHTGGGALDRLGALRAGQRVTVYRSQSGGRVAAAYQVTDVRTYSYDELANDAQQLFGQQRGRGRLVLVTCTGWDGRQYHGNVVVLATPIAATTAS